MKIVVTGGAGFIGSHLCEKLVEKGHQVSSFDNFWRGKKDNLANLEDNNNFTSIEGDIRNKQQTTDSIKGADVVYHLAAINGTKYFYEEPLLITDVNVQGTLNVLEASKQANVKKYIFASSPEIYGEPRSIPTKEEEECVLDNPLITLRHSYSASKFLGEILGFGYHQKFNLPVINLRYFNIYGPRLIGSPYGQVVSIFVKNALENKDITVFGDGSQTRSFTYVDDAVNATIKLMDADQLVGKAINLGNNQETSVLELANKVIESTGIDKKPIFGNAMPGDSKRRCPNTEKAEQILNWKATTTLEEGIGKTIDWFKSNN